MLHSFAHDPNVVVLGLPRGGMPVAREIAEALEVPLDVLPVQRLGTTPWSTAVDPPGVA